MTLTFNFKLTLIYIVRVFQLGMFSGNVAGGDSSCDDVVIRKSCLMNLRDCELCRALRYNCFFISMAYGSILCWLQCNFIAPN